MPSVRATSFAPPCSSVYAGVARLPQVAAASPVIELEVASADGERRVLQKKTSDLLGLYKMSWAFSLAGGRIAPDTRNAWAAGAASGLMGTISGSGVANVLTAPSDTAPFLTDWRKRYTGRAQAVVRPATTDEIDMWKWHQQMLAKENER